MVEPLTEEEVQRFLRSFNIASDLSQCRDYTMFRLILETGLRPIEIVALDLDDVDLERCRIRVPGTTRYVNIGEEFLPRMEDYIVNCRCWLHRGHPVLFPSRVKTESETLRFKSYSLSYIAQQAFRRAGIPIIPHQSISRLLITWESNKCQNSHTG